MLEKITKNNKFVTAVIIIGFLFFLISFLIFSWEINFNFSQAADASRLGQLGDFIGGISGSLWALVGVLLFYKALVDQKEDFKKNRESVDLQVKALNSQIEEFKATREEQRLARKAYEEQVKTAQFQQFDNSFFSLFQIYSKAKEDLEIRKNFPQQFSELVQLEYGIDSSKNYIETWPEVIENFLNLNITCRDKLYPYYRSFYRLMRFIDLSNILSEEEKYHYAKVVRSQISEYEALILFLNSFTDAGSNSRSLVIKYNLFKHISVNDISKIITKSEINYNLLRLINSLDKFLIEHLPKNYDIENTKTEFQEEIEFHNNLIIGVDFSNSEEIILKIYTENDLDKHKLDISEDGLKNSIKNHLALRVILQKYLDHNKVEIQCHTVAFDDRKEYCFTIRTKESATLLEDKI